LNLNRSNGPRAAVDPSNLINERVNYDHITNVSLGSTPEGFQITITTDRLQAKFLVIEEWRAQNVVDFVAREIDLFDLYGARRGRLDRIQGTKPQRLNAPTGPSGSLPLHTGCVGARGRFGKPLVRLSISRCRAMQKL
jgi:hypothetical protein